MSNFKKEFDKASKEVRKSVNKTIIDATSELFKDIIDDTPVKTGQLKGNWHVTLDVPGALNLKGFTDPGGSSTKSKADFEVAKFKLVENSDIFMTNNLDYARRIEFGQYSTQAPEGMVRINLMKFQDIVDKNAKKNKV